MASPGAKAVGTVTFAANPAEGEIVAVGGNDITFVAVPALPFDVEIGIDEIETAVNFAILIAANLDLYGVTAGGMAPVVELTARYVGTYGNTITLDTDSAVINLSGPELTGGLAATAIKLDIMERLTAHLKNVIPANGYEFNLSVAVFRGRRVYGDDDPKTMISIVEHLQPDSSYQPAAEEGVGSQEDWILLVQGWADGADKDNPTDKLYQMEAEVRRHLSRLIATVRDDRPEFPDEFMLGMYGKGISGIRLGPGVVGNILPDVSDRNFFWLPLVIELALDSRQPFVV